MCVVILVSRHIDVVKLNRFTGFEENGRLLCGSGPPPSDCGDKLGSGQALWEMGNVGRWVRVKITGG